MSVNIDEVNGFNKRINANNTEIRKIERDIEKLNNYRLKLKKVMKNMEELSIERRRKLNYIPSLLEVPIKLNLFSSMVDSISGTRYSNAISDINSSVRKIDDKILELKNRIKYLRNQNDIYITQVNVLKDMEAGG